MGWIVSLAASAVGLFFALIVTGRFLVQKKQPDLLFAISLYMFSLAAFLEYCGGAFLWIPWMYKLYYFLAITLVPVMAAAVLQLQVKPWIGHLFLAYAVLLSLLFLWALIPGRVDEALLYQADSALGGEAMPAGVRRFSFWLSGVGGIALIALPAWTWWKSRVKGFLYLASGALVMSLGGGLAKLDFAFLLSLSELIGIVLLFFGYIQVQKQAEPGANEAAAALVSPVQAEEPPKQEKPSKPEESLKPEEPQKPEEPLRPKEPSKPQKAKQGKGMPPKKGKGRRKGKKNK